MLFKGLSFTSLFYETIFSVPRARGWLPREELGELVDARVPTVEGSRRVRDQTPSITGVREHAAANEAQRMRGLQLAALRTLMLVNDRAEA